MISSSLDYIYKDYFLNKVIFTVPGNMNFRGRGHYSTQYANNLVYCLFFSLKCTFRRTFLIAESLMHRIV